MVAVNRLFGLRSNTGASTPSLVPLSVAGACTIQPGGKGGEGQHNGILVAVVLDLHALDLVLEGVLSFFNLR